MEPGQVIFIRSNTRDDYIGRVVRHDGLFVELSDASWIGDSGRFGAFIRNGIQTETEIEYVGAWTTSISAWCPWPHELPKGDLP